MDNDINGLRPGRSRRRGAAAARNGAAGVSGTAGSAAGGAGFPENGGEKAWKTESGGEKAWKTEADGEKAWKTETGGEKAWKTGKRPKKNSSLARIRIRRLIVFAILEVFVLAGIFAYAYVLKQYNKIQRPEFEVSKVENTVLSSEDIQKMKGYWNIAAFGVDSRDSSIGRGNNSDVIIIVSINRENGEIRMVSVFRDSYLSLSNGSYSKINAAYAIGGPEQAVRALNQNLDLNITDYVTFNWKAVATGINILGGVDIELTDAEFKYINSYITETVKGTGIGSVQLEHAGANHLDGVQAVAYARLRYMDDDYTRTARQRKIIELCYQKARKADVQTLSDLAGNMLSMVATSLTWEDGMSLAAQVRNYTIAGTQGFPEDRKESIMGPKGACVLPNTLKSNVRQLHGFLFGDEAYECSSQVREIDNRIWSDEANYKARAAASKAEEQEKRARKASEEEEEERERENGSDSENEDGDASGASRTHATDENGEIIEDDFDDPDGEILGPLETDEDGHVIVSTIGNSAPTAPSGNGTVPGGRVSPVTEESGAASREGEEDLIPGAPSVMPAGKTTEADDDDGPNATTGALRNAPGSVVTDETVSAGPGQVRETETRSTETRSTENRDTETREVSPGPVTEAAPSGGPAASSDGPAAPVPVRTETQETTAAAAPQPVSDGPGGASVTPVSAVPAP